MNIPSTISPISKPLTWPSEDFDQGGLPFAAARLTISLRHTAKEEIDEVVEDNFRNEKDVVINKDQGYIVLMRDTTIEAAESAVKRLKNRLEQLARYSNRFKKFGQVRGSAYILGPDKKNNRLQARFLDLGSQPDCRKSGGPAEFGLDGYLRWLDPSQARFMSSSPKVNIKV